MFCWKEKFMGPINSAQDPLEKLKCTSQKKKKKVKRWTQCYPNTHLMLKHHYYLNFFSFSL